MHELGFSKDREWGESMKIVWAEKGDVIYFFFIYPSSHPRELSQSPPLSTGPPSDKKIPVPNTRQLGYTSRWLGTYTATGSLNLPSCCILYMRSPPLTYSITK